MAVEDEGRASERRGTPSAGQGGARPDAAVQPHRMGAGRRPPRPGRVAGGAERAPVSPTWCRSGTGGCWCRRSPSTGARPRSWPPTSTAPPPPACRCSCAGMRICRTSALFASPERRLLFDLNDFDETLPGPFEYDVKRMAASFTIAGRNNGFSKADTRAATLASVAAYREAMAGFAAMGTMDIWYAHLDEDELLQADPQRRRQGRRSPRSRREGGQAGREERPRRSAAKARTRDSLQALSKLGELVDGQYRIVSQPPIVVPVRDLAATYGLSADEVERGDPRAVPRLPGHPAGRSAPAAGAVRAGRRGPQGGRGGQRRHPGLHRPAPGSRPARPAVLAGQGGDRLGPGGPAAQEPLQAARRAGGVRPADDAGRQRHLPGLDQGAWTSPATSTGASCAT